MEEKKEKQTAGIMYTLCGGFCWGLSGCFGQYLFHDKGITAEWMVTIRLFFAGILLLLLGLILTGRQLGAIWRNRRDVRQLLLFSLVGMLSCQYTYFAAIQHSNAGTATVLQALSPMVILAFVCLRGKRHPKLYEAAAIVCALFGVFLLSTHGDIHSMALTPPALLFGIGAAVGAAAYNLLSGDLLRTYGVYSVVGYAMMIAGIVMMLVVRPWQYEILWDKGTILAVVAVVVVGTAIAYALYLKGVSIVGPFLGSIIGMVEPITAVLVSFLFLNEGFGLADFIGFVLILGTATMLTLRSREK